MEGDDGISMMEEVFLSSPNVDDIMVGMLSSLEETSVVVDPIRVPNVRYQNATIISSLLQNHLIKQETTKLNNKEKVTKNSKRKNNNDVSNKPRRPQDCIRNIAVIAHVDHGKTTLSDALLNKAGLLHKDRVGDQSTGRSLDSLKDERERGITIKSSAVTLNLQIHEDVLRRNDTKFSDSTGTNNPVSENENPTEVYIGNLPRDVSEEELRDYLIKIGAGSVSDVRLNDKRGFALANLSKPAELETILALDGAAEMKGRPLVVEISGEDPMHRLKALCDSGSLDMPTISAKEKDDGCSGMAVWPALGDVIIQAPAKYDTKREARRATSFECLRFFASQKGGHREVSEEYMVDAEAKARDKETFVEPSSSGIVPLVVNLIDSPGHVEFSAEVSSSLRVSDGALVVVDALEGKAAQTEGVLIQALREGVQPVLMINKVDRLIIDQQLDAEQVFDRMQLVIDDINAFIAIHQREDFPDQRVSLAAGSVCFGSGYFGWACSIESVIPLFQTEGSSEESVRKALSKRETFIKHIVRPILRMHRASGVLPCLKGTAPTPEEAHQRVSGLLSKISQNKKPVSLLRGGQDAALLDPRKLLKKAMMAWLPAADAIVDMVAAHVPSPVHSQRLRAPLLYSGSLDDPSGQGISSCDCAAPLLVFVSKMAQVDPKNKNLLAFGRVFSGTIHCGDTVRAMRTDNTETEAKVKRILVCGIGARMTAVPSAHAGQLIALEGMDHALDKSGTLAIARETKPIRHMVNSVSPILRYGVKPKDKKQLTKMVSGMHMVVNADATAVFFRDTESGQYILAGTGELHIEVLVSSFLERTGIEVELSEPMVSYRETVQVTSEVALAKSENKHNRIFIKASPLDDGTVEAMASGELVGLDKKSMSRELVHSYGWNSAEASRIWSFGPEPDRGNETSDMDNPTCFLVDSTYGIQLPKDARENIVAAFQQVVREGVLVGSRMRGVRFDLVDAKFHSDSVHRRPGSVVPASARAMKGAFLMAKPRLVEPVYRAGISGSTGSLNGVYSILGRRSATIVDTSSTPTTETIEASLPVRCSFGLAGALRGATKSRARCTCVYSGMRLVPEIEEVEITRNTRQQKGLAEKEPKAENYIDRL